MANIKWSAFPTAANLVTSDILVGLRAGVNSKFSLPQNIATSSTPQFAGAYFGSATGPQATVSGVVQAIAIGGTNASYVAASYNNASGGAPTFWTYKSRSTTVGVFVPVQAGDELGRWEAYADDGTQFSRAGDLTFNAEGTISNGVVPSLFRIFTANASGVRTQALSINSAQIVALANPLAATSGGTGIANLVGSTITLGGALTTAGAFASTFTMTGTTSVTFPTSGTLATTATASGIVNSGLINQVAYYAAAGTTLSGLATANNGLLVTSAGGVPSIGNAILADITIHGVTVGNGAFASTLNLAVGQGALAANVSGVGNVAVGPTALSTLTTGNSTTAVGNAAGTNSAFGVNITTGTRNTFIGNGASGNAAAASGVIALGCFTVADIATGATSSDNGPGISIASSTTPVGFRGDGTIYPSFMGAGSWRMKINDTYYKIPLLADAATSLGALSATQISFTTTSGIIGTTTSDSAAAGSVGQFIDSAVLIGAAVSLTNSTTANVTSIVLTPGDWDIGGNILFTGGASTVCIDAIGLLNTSSATLLDQAFMSQMSFAAGATPFATGNTGMALMGQQIQVTAATTTTVYLIARAGFTISTCAAAGYVWARRRR